MKLKSIIPTVTCIIVASLCGACTTMKSGLSSKGGKWYATCESGHGVWDGPDRNNYQDAKGDAIAHDSARHGGTETASVLQHPFFGNLRISRTTTGRPAAHKPSMRAPKCCSYFAVNDPTHVGLQNECDKCMIAPININYTNGHHEVKDFRVEARSQIYIDVRTWQSSSILTDRPCN